jgi:hypothetical protein
MVPHTIKKIDVIELMTICNNKTFSRFISIEKSGEIISPFPKVLPIVRKKRPLRFARRTISPAQYSDDQRFQSIESFIDFFRFGNTTSVDMEPMFEATINEFENLGILWRSDENDENIPEHLTVSKRFIRRLCGNEADKL